MLSSRPASVRSGAQEESMPHSNRHNLLASAGAALAFLLGSCSADGSPTSTNGTGSSSSSAQPGQSSAVSSSSSGGNSVSSSSGYADISINQTQRDLQYGPRVAIADNGNFVVVWRSRSQGSLAGAENLVGRLFDSQGKARTNEFIVNDSRDFCATDCYDFDVSMTSTGEFVVVWGAAQGSSGKGVYAQRYYADGSPNGAAELIDNSSEAAKHAQVAVATYPSGGFIAIWQHTTANGSGLKARKYGTVGDGGTAFWITTTPARSPKAATNGQGQFAVAYVDSNKTPAVYNCLFANTTAQVPCQTTTHQVSWSTDPSPSIFLRDDGTYVLAATAQCSTTEPCIRFNEFGATGVAYTSDALLLDSASAATIAAYGNVIQITAQRENAKTGSDIVAGTFQGGKWSRGPELANRYTEGNQSKPYMAANALGQQAIVWTDSQYEQTLDSSYLGGIAARVIQ